MLITKFNKTAQVAPAIKSKYPLFFLMVNPENISGDDIDSIHLHLNYLILPIYIFTSAEMELSADPVKRPSVHFHVIVREGNHISLWINAMKMV